MIKLIKQFLTGPTRYSFVNQEFKTFNVQFEANEPDTLTMTIFTKPDVDAVIKFNDVHGCIMISTKPNSFVQREGSAYMISRKKTELIDTAKYTYFITE